MVIVTVSDGCEHLNSWAQAVVLPWLARLPYHTWLFVVGDKVSLCSLTGLELAIYQAVLQLMQLCLPQLGLEVCNHDACPFPNVLSDLSFRFTYFINLYV